MPAIVRRLFEMAMGQADANRNGIPDVFESALGGSDSAALWRNRSGRVCDDRKRINCLSAAGRQTHHDRDRQGGKLTRYFSANPPRYRLACHPGGHDLSHGQIGQRSRSQGGRFYVAIAALVILGAVDSQFRQLIERRAPFSIATTETESRYAMVSLLLMLISTVVRFGAAWFLP